MNAPVLLTREVSAVMIPAGTRVTLPEGLEVIITQSLGGNYTVLTDAGQARIDAKDADALGLETQPTAPPAASSGVPAPDLAVDSKLVWEQLKTCYDPEIPVNIVDLGLIYHCDVLPPEEPAEDLSTPPGRRVEVKMTLTAPGCGMGQILAEDVKHKIESIPGVREASVELVWEPPWHQGMMTEAARLQLGLL